MLNTFKMANYEYCKKVDAKTMHDCGFTYSFQITVNRISW